MNRRRFLSLLSQATAGAAVAYSFPSIIVPKNTQPIEQEFRGLAHLINERGGFFTLSTATFPDLNSPVLEARGAILTPQIFDDARMVLYQLKPRGIEWPFASR